MMVFDKVIAKLWIFSDIKSFLKVKFVYWWKILYYWPSKKLKMWLLEQQWLDIIADWISPFLTVFCSPKWTFRTYIKNRDIKPSTVVNHCSNHIFNIPMTYQILPDSHKFVCHFFSSLFPLPYSLLCSCIFYLILNELGAAFSLVSYSYEEIKKLIFYWGHFSLKLKKGSPKK